MNALPPVSDGDPAPAVADRGPTPDPPSRARQGVAIAAFLVANVAGPFVLGECFPFTTAPMFCQQPTRYCEFRVEDPSGKELPLESLGLQRVYDGNAEGFGVGIQPPSTICSFGQVPTESEVRRHVLAHRDAWKEVPYLMVEMTTIGDVDGATVGEVATVTLRIEAP